MATWYVATAANGGSDSNAGTSSSVPFLTIGKAGLAHAGGDTILISPGTYALANSTANTVGGPLAPKVGTSAAPTLVLGCDASFNPLNAVNDFSGLPVLASSAAAGVGPISCPNTYAVIRNLVLDGVSQTNRCLYVTGNDFLASNVKAVGTNFYGFDIEGTGVLTRCWASGAPQAGFYLNSGVILNGCVATGNTVSGMKIDNARVVLHRCLIHANTGATTDGVIVTGTVGPWIISCTFEGNGRDGVRLSDAGSGDVASIRNSIFYGNSGKAINSVTTNYPAMDANFNAYASGALTNVPAGANDVTLTGDPFTAASSGDFSLNSTAGAGAACRAAGFPGILPGALTTGYVDIGAAQHQDAGGGGTTVYIFGSEG